MKKTGVIVASLMLAGAAAMANVYSVNTVGYQKMGLASNLTMLALNWNTVGGGDDVAVTNLMDTSNLQAGSGFGGADRLYIWNPAKNSGNGAYDIYYLYDADRQWYEFGNDDFPTTNRILRGQGMWIQDIQGGPTNVTFSGEVPMEGTNVTVFAAGKWAMFGSAYTADMQINGPNATWTGNAAAGFGGADRLYVWDPAKNFGSGAYWIYYLYDVDNLWYEFGNDDFPTTHVIPMGRGAWLQSKGPSNTTLTEIRAY
jgi:hypothetical protein